MPESQPKLITFYLPQYHPIAENNEWWGQGFTEWTNVGRAKPLFDGHHQPRVPADLGYYDLRLAETRAAQAALAREYGIHGFCYYHYWFNGRRLLERPFNEVLQSGSPDLPFCLCWANENWTRAWDGLDRQVLIGQRYCPEDDLEHIRWLANVFRDSRYIRVHGKPLFLVYRVASLPDPMQTVSIWREEARRLGIGELYLVSVESRVGGNQSVNPAKFGFDAAVEFQPDGLHIPKPIRRLNDYGGIFDYRAVVENMLKKPEPDYLRFPCVAPGWDNSARRRENPTIITGSTPEIYEQWLEGVVQRRRHAAPDENLIFVNAWNEWGEGAYLEPDQKWGRAYLEATQRVLARHKPSSPAEITSPTLTPPAAAMAAPAANSHPLSVCIPVFNGNEFLEESIRSVLTQSFADFELIIVDDCSTQDPAPIVKKFPDPRLQFHRNAVRQGLVGNWNRCVELASGQYVCVFHQDDVMQPDNLRRKIEALEKNPSAAFAYSDARVVEADLSTRHEGWFTPTVPNEDRLIPGREFFEKLAVGDNFVCCPSVIFRRAAFEQLGRFDPRLPYTADWEMWLRLALQFDVAYLKAPLLLYRVHDHNETHRFKGLRELEQGYRAKMSALRRGAEHCPNAPALRAQVAREAAAKALTAMRNGGHVRTLRDLRAWLAFAAEAHRTSLTDATFEAASEWFLTALESCGAVLAAEDREAGWTDAEEQSFAQAKQLEIEGRSEQALPILERLAALKPASTRLWFQLGRAQMAASRPGDAEKSWSVVLAQKPKDWLKSFHAYAMRGSVCEKQGRKADALADFARAAALALHEGCPDLACEIDQWLVLAAKGEPIGQKKTLSKDQLRSYAQLSPVLQAIGSELNRPGPISSFEFQQANEIWRELLSGHADRRQLARRLENFEPVVAGLAKQHRDRAVERADAAVQSQVAAAWTALTEISRPGSLPENVAHAMRSDTASGEPAVSIVIPTFNRLDMTQRCLASLAKERGGSNYEIIVVDNASTDGTVEFLQAQAAAGALRAILNTENLGFSRACNQGARAAGSAQILFLNNDTEVQPNWLAPLLETIESGEQVAAVGSKLLFPDFSIQHAGVAILNDQQLPDPLVARHIHYRKKQNAPEVSQACTYQALTAACLLVRKSAFEKAGGFDEGYWNGYEDVDLCFKLQQNGGVLVYQPRSVVIHHESQSGPERFRQVAHNIKRLHDRWLNKISPDFIVAPDGKISALTNPRIVPFVAKPAIRAAAPVASLIILAHNQLEHSRLSLESIAAHTPLPHEIILVDNASTDGTSEFFRSLAAQQPNVTVITNTRNLGFAAGNNQGLAVARGECVVLLNNDTIVTPGWLEAMLAALQRHPDIGIVGPMSNYVAGPQLVTDVSYKNLSELPQFAAEWSRAHAGQSQDLSRVVGFCLLARRSVIERIGGLDEQFGSGNFEDDDFCLRAGFAGFRVCLAQDVFIHHTGSQTFKGAKIDYHASMSRNWQLFAAKWGLPKESPIENGYRVPTTPPLNALAKIALPGNSTKPAPHAAAASTPKSPRQARPIVLPPCALLGQLSEARASLKSKKLELAWTFAVAALQARPFHPEAALLLAEIAQAAGDSVAARHCAQHAVNLAPNWKPAKQFLKGNLRGSQKPAWLTLPETITAKSAPRLSVCLIVKNEEKFLARCLASVRELASQIVVVDTGSTDRTVAIAQEFNAEVHSFTWNDDFSAARNEALQHVTGDWVLAFDADEELLPEHRQTILSEMQAAAVMAWRLPIIDVGREAEGCSYVPRLFRNAPGLFYVGRVHEQVFTSIEVRRQEWGLENRLGRSALLHHGYTKEIVADRDKIQRNLRLLKLAVEELPDEPNLVMSLGLELVRSGEVAAGLEKYWEAFHLLAALPPTQVVPELRETLLTQLTTHLLAARRFLEILQLWQLSFAKSSPITASQHFLIGLAHLELKKPADAATHMRQCLAKRGKPALSPVNPEILKAGPQHCLALALAAQKESDAAEKAFQAALADDPQSRDVRFDFARFRAEQAQPLEALKLLNELVAENPADARVWQFGAQLALSQPDFLEFAADWTGEALKHFPQHPAILGQRAEALLLAQNVEEALPLWTRAAAAAPRDHRALAALVLCETLAGECPRRFAPAEETAVSQEFLKWYRRLIAFRAHDLVARLNSGMDQLRPVLPAFTRTWDAAAKQAAQAVSA